MEISLTIKKSQNVMNMIVDKMAKPHKTGTGHSKRVDNK